MGILSFIVVGALAGWLGGLLMRGRGFGIVANVFIGILGALLGGFLFDLAGFRFGGFAGSLLMALVGAMILIAIGQAFGRRR